MPALHCNRALVFSLLLAVVLVGLGAGALATAAPASAGPQGAPLAGPPGSPGSLFALLAVQQAQLTATCASDGLRFGSSVAVSGDTAVVGACSNTGNGFACVYVRSGTTWSQQAKLTGDVAAGDYFGNSVAISGDTIAVGTPHDTVGAIPDQGSAYVFTRSGTTWSQQTKLIAADGATGDFFGHSVAISGDTVVVGATFDNVGANADQGSAYVFTRSGATWSQQTKLTAADGAGGDYFGKSVAIAGDTVAVGAVWDDIGANADQGSAYVFTRSGTTWGQQAKLTASDGAAGDYFGNSVAVSGDTAVVGAATHDVGANADQGSAYVFARSGTTWAQQAQLTAADGAAGDVFGYPVAIAGDTVVVGASGDDVGANANQGSAYVFARSGTTWSQQAKLTAADGAAGDGFGNSVAIAGDTVVVGAPDDGYSGCHGAGSAAVFTRSGTTWGQQESLVPGGEANDRFGYSVAIAGDTAVVGAGDDVGANGNQGSAYVYTRSGTTWSQQARLTAADGAAGDYFGDSVAIAGDTVVVSASDDDIGANANQGSAYVFARSGTTWSQQAKLTAADGAANDWFGYPVAISADTVVVGAPEAQNAAYVFARSGTTWSQQAKLTAVGSAAFGSSVAISGNTVVVGAPYTAVGANLGEGAAYVFTRSATTWTQQANLITADGAEFDQLGTSVAISGDTVVAGAPYDRIGTNGAQGSACVYERMGRTWWAQKARLVADDGADSDFFGTSVAVTGGTVVVGAYNDNGAGSAYVFWRGATTWTQRAHLTAADAASGDAFGYSVAISGDAAVVGAFRHDVGANADQGSAYVFTGVMAPPGKPIAKSPKGLITSRAPTFRWAAAPGAASYEVRVYRGSRLIRKKAGIKKLSWTCTQRLPRGVSLTWKVRAANEGGPGSWSSRPRFKVR